MDTGRGADVARGKVELFSGGSHAWSQILRENEQRNECKRRYCSDRAELANLYVHLTNVAIQKKADDYDKEIGCKWDLQSLKVICFGTLQHVQARVKGLSQFPVMIRVGDRKTPKGASVCQHIHTSIPLPFT